MTSPSKAAEYIVCPTCSKKATRAGAQDACDVYVCEEQHITRIRVGFPRNEWKTE
jgi:hypothetical protein